MAPSGNRSEPTVDSFDRIRGEVPPPPEWTATGTFDWQVTPTFPNEPPGYAFTSRWASPVFDLRPDLSSRIGTTKQGFPIWRRYARLRVQLSAPGGGLVDFTNMTVEAIESVQVFDANVQSTTVGAGSSPRPNLFDLDRSDVTSTFFPAAGPPSLGIAQSALGEFAFRGNNLGGGEGYPIRYFRIELFFRKFVETGLPLPPAPPFPTDIALGAAVY
jgi:hypothetical protein